MHNFYKVLVFKNPTVPEFMDYPSPNLYAVVTTKHRIESTVHGSYAQTHKQNYLISYAVIVTLFIIDHYHLCDRI